MQLDVMAQQQNWVRIMKPQALLQPTHDFPRTSPESSLSVLMPGTYRGPSGDSQGTNTKTDDLMKKMFFRSNILALHIYSCFLQEEQIFKSSKRGSPRDVYRTQLRDVLGNNWWDVLGTLAGHWSNIFKIQFTNTLNLLWQVTKGFIVNGSSEKFSKQCSS